MASIVLALVMLLSLASTVWATEAANRVALNTIIEAEDGTFDGNTAHVAYSYDETKTCKHSKQTESGAYIEGDLPWVKTVTITGVDFAELADGNAEMALLQSIIMNGRRTDFSGQFQDSIEVNFVNCTFHQSGTHLQVYKICPVNVTKYTFDRCEFYQESSSQYALTLNVSETSFDNWAISYVITNSLIKSSGRGINIIPGTENQVIGSAKPTVVISGNTFQLPQDGPSNMALQIAGNWDGAGLSAAGSEMITFSGNKITAFAAVRIHSSMSSNTTDSVKYLAKFEDNTLSDGVTPVIADGEDTMVSEITAAYQVLLTPPPAPTPTPDPTPVDPEPERPAHTNRRYPAANNTTAATESKAAGETVDSAKTFDAGVVLYVGMSALSLTGSAALLGRRKEF